MKRIFKLLLAVASATVLTGCIHDKPQSSLRIVHAGSDAPKVDVAVSGVRVLDGVGYKQASSFFNVEAGERELIVTPAGATTPEVIKANVTLPENGYTTVVAVGKLGSNSIEPLVIVEDGNAPGAGKLKMRAGHAAPDVPAVDIYVTAPEADLTTAAPAVANAAYKAVSDVLSIDGGDYRIRATLAGTRTVAYDSGKVTLAAGSDLVALAVPATDGNSPVGLLVLTRGTPTTLELPDATAQVRVVHASPDAPAVDVLVDGSKALADVAYPADSGYLGLLAGARNFKVNAAGTAATVIDVTPTLAAGKSYTVLAVGFLSAIEPLLLEDNRTSTAGKALIRVVHASPDAPSVDVLANEAKVLSNVPFKAASSYLPVDPGTVVFKLNLAGTGTTAYATPALALEAGKVYTAIAIGSAAGGANPLTVKLTTDN